MQGIEPLLQLLRIRKILSHLPASLQKLVLVDFGCDHEQTLIKQLAPQLKKAIGIDFDTPSQKNGNIQIINGDLEKKLPLKAKTANIVTMLAVLEHLAKPNVSIKEAFRILKPGGIFIGTVPSPKSQPLLDLLAPLGLVRKDMIEQHHNYFTVVDLKSRLKKAGFKQVKVERWELGFNTFFMGVKP
jgi:ubiquinone/menaquinone biosynthesis C-methylase UbiE